MKEKGRCQIWMVMGVSCFFVILPCLGYGAGLTIGNNIYIYRRAGRYNGGRGARKLLSFFPHSKSANPDFLSIY